MIWDISFNLQAFNKKPPQKNHIHHVNLSHVLRFHISPYTQFADHAPFRHALYASLRGSVLLACPLPQLPLPLNGQLPAMNLSLLNPGGVNFRDQILCYSHK